MHHRKKPYENHRQQQRARPSPPVTDLDDSLSKDRRSSSLRLHSPNPPSLRIPTQSLPKTRFRGPVPHTHNTSCYVKCKVIQHDLRGILPQTSRGLKPGNLHELGVAVLLVNRGQAGGGRLALQASHSVGTGPDVRLRVPRVRLARGNITRNVSQESFLTREKNKKYPL